LNIGLQQLLSFQKMFLLNLNQTQIYLSLQKFFFFFFPIFSFLFLFDFININSKREKKKNKTVPNHITFSKDKEMFVSMGQDRLVRIFNFRTGKLHRVYDESLKVIIEMQQVFHFFFFF